MDTVGVLNKMLKALAPGGILLNAIPDLTQTRIDVFKNGHLLHHCALEQALCEYDHILDNIHALALLLDDAVRSGRLTSVASGSFLFEPWNYRDLTDELTDRQTKTTAEILKGIDGTYLVQESVEVYATESVFGTWYQTQTL